MPTGGWVAVFAAVAFSTVAAAADVPQAPAGLVGGVEGVGEAPLDLADRPGVRLFHSFRLRVELSDRLNAVAHGATPARTMLVDKSRARRVASLVDFYPVDDNGFHLTAGLRKLPRPSRRTISGYGAGTAFDLAGINTTAALGARSNIARRSPTMMAGWTGMAAKEMQIGFSAGAAEEHGKEFAAGGAFSPSGSAKRWSRVGEVAQVNLAMHF